MAAQTGNNKNCSSASGSKHQNSMKQSKQKLGLVIFERKKGSNNLTGTLKNPLECMKCVILTWLFFMYICAYFVIYLYEFYTFLCYT